jgi:hypothetical protein
MKELLHLLFLTIFPALLAAQSRGLLINDDAYNRLNRQPVYEEGSKAENAALKDNPKIDLRPFCPTPQDQGSIGSCTGWSSGYGAASILYAIQKNWAGKKDSINQSAFSALFIYNQIKEGSCDAGSYIDKAGELLRDKGDVPSKKFDRLKNACDRQPTEEEMKLAKNYRIKDYMTLFSTDAAERVKIEKTKLSLLQKKPVVIGMLIRRNFDHVRKRDQYWHPDTGDTTFNGAHAMVVVGYDDGKEAFEIMNSWGINWGNEGFVWVKYSDYARFCCYGIQFVPSNEIIENQPFTLVSHLRNPSFDADDNLTFSNKEVYFNGTHYELADESVPRDFLAQILIDKTTSGAYLYAFSYDTRRQVKVHWPRDGQLDQKFEGQNESAIITVPDIRLAIPDALGALSFPDVGTEYICLLVAKEPLSNFNAQLQKLSQLPASNGFVKNLYTAFDKTLMPAKSIKYSTEFVGFNNPIKQGIAVPVVLQVKVK